MTTRNFRVNNGLEVGDIVISASANTITGGATAAPSADGQFANKKYVDDQAAATLTLTNKTLTAPKIADAGFIADANGNESVIFQTTASAVNELEITNAATGNGPILGASGETNVAINITAKGTGNILLNAGSDVVIPANKGLQFTDANEKIESDGTDLTINSGAKINLTATSDVHIPQNIGIVFDANGSEKIESDDTNLTISSGAQIILAPTTDVKLGNDLGVIFGDAGEKIEGDGTDLTISSSNLLNLSAATDIVIPTNVGLHFTDSAEKIESDGTDLTINSGAKINLTATSDVHIPKNIGIVFDDNASEKIESDDTDLTISSGAKINLAATSDVHLANNIGMVFGGASEKIEGDGTDLTISGAKINLNATTDAHLANDIGLVFGDAGEKIEGDGTNLTISSSGLCTITATGNTVITNNALISGNLVLTGNLTVNGSTTTVATTNTTIADNLIELNTGISASSNDAGLIIERGSTGNNAAIIWDESTDKFAMGLTTSTAADKSGGITVSVGTLLANLEGAVTGDVTGTADVATAVTAADESSDTSCNVLFVTAATGDLPPKTGTNLTFNSSSGVLTATGFAGALTGDVTGNADTATVGTTVTVSDNESTNESNVILFAAGAAGSGNLGVEADGNMTYNPSTGKITATGFVGDLTGTASAAEYSDVAERFASDSVYAPGTVVALGGAEEITQVNEEASDEVFGVVSSLKQAAFKMNAGAGSDDSHPFIAMTGRVDVKVIGTVNKGDRLVSASVPGYARAATKAECTAFNVIGRALTGKTEAGQGSVKAAVRVSH